SPTLWMLARSRENRPMSARDALHRLSDLLHQLATDASHVDLASYLAKTFAGQGKGDKIVPQRTKEEEPTRQIDGPKLWELSRTVPNFPLTSPLFTQARKEMEILAKDGKTNDPEKPR